MIKRSARPMKTPTVIWKNSIQDFIKLSFAFFAI